MINIDVMPVPKVKPITVEDIKESFKRIEKMEKQEKNVYGVDGICNIIKFLLSIGDAYKKAKADDGNITIDEYLYFIRPVTLVPGLIKGIGDVSDEIKDTITKEEAEQIAKLIAEEGLFEGDTDAAIADGVKVAAALKEYIEKYFA